METRILHMDLDSFFVSVERLFDPSLNGKPVIVGGSSTRGVVSSCSYEARQYGIHSAMPTVKAKQLCPHAIFLHGRMHDYGEYSKRVTDIIADRAPLFEKASIDEFYLDLTGMEKYFGAYKWASDLRQTIIRETKLPISWGLSSNKMMAKMATNEAKPNGQYEIKPGTEQAFLDPLPVGKIPFCGEKTEAFLNGKGIKTIYDLRQFSREAMYNLMGKGGVDLWERAHGRATTTLQPYHDAKSMSSERTFNADTDDTDFLRKVIVSLAEQLAFELRSDKKMTACVGIRVRYSNFETHTKQLAIPATSNSKVLTEKAIHLFNEFYDRTRKVRLLGIKFLNLDESAQQINMFEDREKDLLLYKAIDNLKNKHGIDKITLAQNLNLGNIKRNDPKAQLDKEAKKERKKPD
ncbi:MAG TPA: DNA polymerase IV [Chitinophagales bacterium]|nr:DNA polymerase IV [Chitinophagales bacterium]